MGGVAKVAIVAFLLFMLRMVTRSALVVMVRSYWARETGLGREVQSPLHSQG